MELTNPHVHPSQIFEIRPNVTSDPRKGAPASTYREVLDVKVGYHPEEDEEDGSDWLMVSLTKEQVAELITIMQKWLDSESIFDVVQKAITAAGGYVERETLIRSLSRTHDSNLVRQAISALSLMGRVELRYSDED